jgi:hypothetical protein
MEILGVFNVQKILAWEDIRDTNGRVLVVSWPKDADKFQEVWARVHYLNFTKLT